MALITSDCDAMRSPSIKTALVTSGLCGLQVHHLCGWSIEQLSMLSTDMRALGAGPPIAWTIPQPDGPNHLGL